MSKSARAKPPLSTKRPIVAESTVTTEPEFDPEPKPESRVQVLDQVQEKLRSLGVPPWDSYCDGGALSLFWGPLRSRVCPDPSPSLGSEPVQFRGGTRRGKVRPGRWVGRVSSVLPVPRGREGGCRFVRVPSGVRRRTLNEKSTGVNCVRRKTSPEREVREVFIGGR